MVPQVLADGMVEFMPFIMIIAVVALLFWFLINKTRLEHQQIMAAIEKGTPLSELRPVKQPAKQTSWIKSLSTGIAFLLMGIGASIISLITPKEDDVIGFLVCSFVLSAIGAGGFVRGILQRKADKEQSALDAKNGQ